MERDLREVISRHGYLMTHKTLQDIMRQDYEYLKSVFEPAPLENTHIITIENEPSEKQTKRGRKPKAAAQNPKVETEPNISQENPEVKNVFIQPEKEEELLSISNFIPNLTESSDSKPPTFKDSKEQKTWQKEMEAKKKAENDAAGITFSQVLTKENLRQWIEEEGRTYAWVAREKAGCPDAQVAATAQMMGIKSKITKKRGIIMSRH